MTHLSVNLNRVALLRNSRPLDIPNLLHCARLVLAAGADGITLHPRPDQRHVRSADVGAMAELLREWPTVEYNLEGNPLHNLLDHVEAVRPQQATFVPDGIDASTSDHGWSFPADGEVLRPLVARARAAGARVSLFLDADPAAMEYAREIGADRVELYTEPYARAHGGPRQAEVLGRFQAAAAAAVRAGLEVNAGHDLNLRNLADFLRSVPVVREVSIGHALVGDALEYGLVGAVQRYLEQISFAAHSVGMPGSAA
jgi:pyridoxine 5-phosphate synthase